MSLTSSIITGGSNSHQTTSEEANAYATDILVDGVIGTLANTSGVAPSTGGYAVNAQGSPDATVAVSAGVLYTTATPTGGNSQRIRTKNSASANVTIAANASGSTKYDWIYLKVDPDKAATPNASATDVGTLVASRSSSPTTDNGTPPTYGTLLAVVTVANGFSTITNGTIADKRAAANTGATSATSYFGLYDFVESGCVWSGDAYASTLNASMTAGYIWIGGVRLTVAAVTARAFTASKDTYIDASNNGDGTALLTYTAATNNAASSALSAGSVRIGIVVTGASTIAAAASINQGQEDRVLPIASSIPYVVTDSLGNLICPRDPNRKLLGYSRRTSTFTTSTVGSFVDVAGLQTTFIQPAGRKVKARIEAVIKSSAAAGQTLNLAIRESSTIIAQATINDPVSGYNAQLVASQAITPTTATHTYKVSVAQNAGAGTLTFEAGTGVLDGYAAVELIIELE